MTHRQVKWTDFLAHVVGGLFVFGLLLYHREYSWFPWLIGAVLVAIGVAGLVTHLVWGLTDKGE
jgi:hypothetical protein